MSTREHLAYWVLPLLAGWTFIAMYFSQIHWMQELIAPAFNREFGLLENLGAALILSSLAVLLKISRLPMKPAFRVVVLFACALTGLMFLEEIDYGLHLIDWVNGVPHGAGAQVRNFHNQGNNTNNIKLVANVMLASIFVILPYIDALKRYRVVKILSPSKMIVFTVVAAAFVALLHEALDPYGLPSNRSLDSNQSEFEEVVIYYAFLVYFVEKYRRFKSAPELLTKSVHHG